MDNIVIPKNKQNINSNINKPIFNECITITKNEFPSLDELKDIFYENNFNNILNTVKNRIIVAKRTNLDSARMQNADFVNIPQNVINDVKKFLREERKYVLTDIEDNAGVSVGWKINLL